MITRTGQNAQLTFLALDLFHIDSAEPAILEILLKFSQTSTLQAQCCLTTYLELD